MTNTTPNCHLVVPGLKVIMIYYNSPTLTLSSQAFWSRSFSRLSLVKKTPFMTTMKKTMMPLTRMPNSMFFMTCKERGWVVG